MNELPKDTLEADRKLSWLQNFVLDAAGPLAAAYDALMLEEEPHPDKIIQLIQLSLRILGNTSSTNDFKSGLSQKMAFTLRSSEN